MVVCWNVAGIQKRQLNWLFKPAGVICEIMNDDGTMARAPQIVEFAKKFGYAVVTIEDLVEYKLQQKL
jgi:3,4-dihydroxy 2-butanone 4-phosphate synthase